MELTYEEYLRLGNGKEHLQVVLGNLRIANTELSNILSSIKEAKKLLNDTQFERDGVLNDIGFAKHAHKERTAELDNRELSVSARENKIDTKEKLALSELSDLNRKITDSEVFYSKLKINRQKENDELVLSINAYEEELESIRQQINDYTNIASQKSQDIKKLENERIGLIAELENSTKAHSDFKRESEKEKGEILSEIERERERVSIPMQLLLEKESIVEAKIKNLAVLQSRIRRQFHILNPDRLLPIELQEK